MKIKSILAVAAVLFFSSNSYAGFIVDTGPGSSSGTNWSLFSSQSLAAEFTVASNTTITDIEGWMANTNGGTGTIALYSDGGNLPGTELFSSGFTSSTLSSAAWSGVSGLSWNVAAGTYWVAFEVRPGDALEGAMPGASASPLLNEAFNTGYGTSWSEYDGLDIGVRISAVPVPAAVWLFASGLIGLIGVARRKL